MASRIVLLAVAATSAALAAAGPASAERGVEPAIIGGGLAAAGSWPAMAGLEIRATDGTGYRCGGTLVAPTVVLTAAHCLSISPKVLSVAASRATIGGGTYGTSQVEWTAVSIHPQYLNLDYDVALIQLAAPSANAPMPLLPAWRDGLLVDGVLLDAAGYGQTAEGVSGSEPSSSALRETTVPLVDSTTCARFFGSTVTPRVLCAGYRGAQGTNVCFGDSGGPLALPIAGTRLLVGAVSFVADECWTAAPAGFGRLSAFRAWLVDAGNGAPHVALRAWLATQAVAPTPTVTNAGPTVTLSWSVPPANWTTTGFATSLQGVEQAVTGTTASRSASVPGGGTVRASVTPIVGVGTATTATFEGTPTPTRAPTVTATIPGAPVADVAVTAEVGSDDPWAAAPTVQWTWNDEPIPGATSTTYTPTREQMSGRLGVTATAANAAGSGTGSAKAGALVAAVPLASTTKVPTTGTARPGRRLKVTAPIATGYPQPTVAYQWLRDGRAISRATTASFRVRAIDVGRSLRCRITYANRAGTQVLRSTAVRVRR